MSALNPSNPISLQLGCCYYPEQWPESMWANDAARMFELGLRIVRIGEFSWAKLEPKSGDLHWEWLDRAMDTLGAAGLKVVLGTPTATPPRWMLTKYPDMLALDREGRPRGFGSRRHYCFSHAAYRKEATRIASLMAERYALHPALLAWQIDNEYGCHDTTRSYSSHAQAAFQTYLAEHYDSISALNDAWGNVFWSMDYAAFDEVALPNLTVTEANPAHWLDFYRFSSRQVEIFNRAQVNAIRQFDDKPLIHNYMGRIVDFDHYAVGNDLEIASWDSYPLGFLVDRSGADPQWQQRFERQGDPDLQALHHDLYRSVGHGRWWIMEQQPGPVNWAPNNPAPLPGMVEFWTLEALAHQAEAVCYFRWRQAPFAQEQMHAGLLRPDDQPAMAYNEVKNVFERIEALGAQVFTQADVAIVFDYESCWAWEAQPQGELFDGFSIVLEYYRALRRLGINIDVVSPNTDLTAYKVVLAPGIFAWSDAVLNVMRSPKTQVVIGPRSGSKTKEFRIPEGLPPAITGFDCKITHVESFHVQHTREVQGGGFVHSWLEHSELGEDVHVKRRLTDGTPVLIQQEHIHYFLGWLSEDILTSSLEEVLVDAGVETFVLPEGVRRRVSNSHEYLFNYNSFAETALGSALPAASVIVREIK